MGFALYIIIIIYEDGEQDKVLTRFPAFRVQGYVCIVGLSAVVETLLRRNWPSRGFSPCRLGLMLKLCV